MFRFSTFLFILSILFFPNHSYSKKKEVVKLKAFYTPKDIMGWDVMMVGNVISFSSREEFEKDDLLGRGEVKSKVTVRLTTPEHVNNGDTLLIINSTNLIVSRFKVAQIFDSTSFGKFVVGYGNFKLASLKDRVVKRISERFSGYSYIHKSRGDYFKKVNQVGQAISEYKKALELDADNPSARLELGYLYIDQGLRDFAFREFQVAYRNMKRLYDNEDKYRLLKGLADISYYQVFNSNLLPRHRKRYRNEGIKYCQEALEVYPESVEVAFMIGKFYYYNALDDVKAKNYFLKVVKLDPEHPVAYVHLSELYYKYGNKKKGRMYAKEALRINPNNARARDLLQKK